MSLSNTTTELLAASPYWDDFSADKRFHRILFKPKKPVQTRELNQVQSIIQNQISELGAGIFKEGAAVVGGNSVFANNVLALQLVRDDNIDIDNFYDANTGYGDTVRGLTSGAEARIIQVDTQSSESYSAVVIVPMASNKFVGGETVSFINTSSNSTVATMVIAPDPIHVKNSATYSIQEGTFFLRGHLVDVGQQTIVLSTNTNLVNVRVGFEVSENFIEYIDDPTLLDPALGTTNYAAPGADRLKLTATLTSKPITGTTLVEQNSDENFIEISRIVNGVPSVNIDRIEPSLIEETLARRTYDESGDYVTVPFRLTTKPHNPPANIPNTTGTITGNTASTTVIAGGVATLFDSEVAVGDVLVVNGERRAVSSVSSNTVLAVNNAFSVDFTNTSFTKISDNKMNLELEAGKAYVRGHEFETLGTTIVQVDKPRTTVAINNGEIGTFYGPYVYVKQANSALFNVNTFEQVDLHCVPFSGINTSANTYISTRIGTARVRSFVYSSGNGDANTVYKMYLVGAKFETRTFGVTAAANSDSLLTAVNVSSSGVLTLTHNSSSASVSLLPAVNTAYIGSRVSLSGTDDSILKYFVTTSNSVLTGNSMVVTMTLDSNAYTEKVNVLANVTFSFTDKSIRGMTESISKTKGASVDVSSQLRNMPSGNTVLFGSDSSSLLFKFRESWIKQNTLTDQRFTALKLYTAQTAIVQNGTHDKYTLTCNSNMEFYPAPGSLTYTNFLIANSSGKFVAQNSAFSVAITTDQVEIYTLNTHTGANPITVLAKMSVASGVESTKVLYRANTNTASVGVSGSDVVSNTNNNMGHIAINVINATSSSVVSLGIPDAYALQKVYAVVTASDANTWVDVTANYDLDNGQRSWCYDYASIVLKPGYAHHATATRALVMVDRFVHTYNETFFTVDSYIGSGLTNEYVDIPTFTDPSTGNTISLRDYVDFRAVRTANVVSANTATNPSTANAIFATNLISHPDLTFSADYEYYLPRIDKVVLTKSRELKAIQGLPNPAPKAPADPENSMTLYIVKYPPYVANTALVQVQPMDHRRYTMRDIGRLEKRIEHLEYYVQLSLLEERTLNQPELDGDDIERFKNGILIDPFASYTIANASDTDYQASIDRTARELRPSFVSHGFHLSNFVTASSSNTVKVGTGLDDSVILNYTSNTFISQPLASTKININPFNVASWRGRMTLSPSTDQWMDTLSRGTVTLNLFDENSNWSDGTGFGFGTVWGDWQDNWSGKTVNTKETSLTGSWHKDGDPDTREQWFTTTTTETVVSQTNTPWRTGQQIYANMSIVTKNLGEKVVDISVAPYMRAANVIISATGLKPNSRLIAFFDEHDVTNYVDKANEIRLANTTLAATFKIGEVVTSNATTSVGTGTVVGIINDTLKVANATGRFYETGGNVVITGAISGTVAVVSAYLSFSGKLIGATSTANVTLDTGSFTVSGAYVGNVINITSGTGEGQRSTITTFDGATGYAGISPVFTTIPAIGSTYSIGPLITDGLAVQANAGIGYTSANASSLIPGSFYGMFRLPGTKKSVNGNNVQTITAPSLKFNTGKRLFRLTDNASSLYANTQVEAAYEASGHTKVVETTIVATREISFTRGPLLEQTGTPVTSTTSSTTSNTQWSGVYVDPLAQTFLIDGSRYANGVFITSVDLFFGRKDSSNIPVTVQIRPTVNGYPSSDSWLTEVTIPSAGTNQAINLIPDDVTPNPANTAHYTRFTFPQPTYLSPGQEYAIVLLSNSFEYEVFVGEIGEQIVGSTRIISEQPYGGSLFKSQNARTWTAEQNQDLMFVLNKATFQTTGSAAFKLGETVNANSAGTNSVGDFDYDVINIQTGHLDFPPTANATAYTIQITTASDNTMATAASVRADQDLFLLERSRIRTANATCVDFRVTMGTTDPHVTPVYDLGRMSLITVRNVIDNGGLYSNGITILHSGAGFTPGTFVITANDTYGTGAVISATANSAGQISNVVVTTAGSGYIQTPTLTWGATASTNAVIVYRGETSANVSITGDQKARYISKKVTLADGFDASDLKVYLSANRPPGTNIEVYHKILATGDTEQFNTKPWTRMIVKPGSEYKYSSDSKQFNEYEYRTTSNNASYVANSVTFDRFHTFAIKVVMRSSDTAVVPRIRNLRAIALDE